jgi:hypothetical protein
MTADINAPIRDWTVRAVFRVRGAIGAFQIGDFTVRAVTAEDACELFRAFNAERYEINMLRAQLERGQ